MSSPECTVVIPTRDCADYIPAALESVRAQGCANLEVIVINDGSTDDTCEVVRRFAADWPELRSIDTVNVGPAHARNAALAEARAPLIAFHRANPDVSFSFTDYLHVDPQGRSMGTCFDYWRPQYLGDRGRDHSYFCFDEPEAAILTANVVGTSTVVASLRDLQIANGFGNLSSAEDWRTWLRLAKSGRVAVSRAVTMRYLVRPNSVSRRRMDRIRAIEAIIAEYGARDEASMRAALRSTRAIALNAKADHWRAESSHFSALMCRLHAMLIYPDRKNVRTAVGDIRSWLRNGTEA